MQHLQVCFYIDIYIYHRRKHIIVYMIAIKRFLPLITIVLLFLELKNKNEMDFCQTLTKIISD